MNSPAGTPRDTSGRIVKRVVVAGGGTVGWVTATALVRHLGPLLDITLVILGDAPKFEWVMEKVEAIAWQL